jgi:hypothetical protein
VQRGGIVPEENVHGSGADIDEKIGTHGYCSLIIERINKIYMNFKTKTTRRRE